MRRLPLLLAAAAMLVGSATAAADDPIFIYGSSDADSIEVFSGLPGYKNSFWWDHPNLTVAVHTAPNVDAAKLEAIRDAIEVWRAALATQLPEISLTDVTGAPTSDSADILVHYVPNAGGSRWGGNAHCGVQKCLNVIIRSDLHNHYVTGETKDFSPVRLQRLAVHELGHALGLGHAAPIEESRDVMGYGWIPDLVPILSDCDLAGIRAAFSWVFEGQAPHPSAVPEVTC